jgi:hypothetical protein
MPGPFALSPFAAISDCANAIESTPIAAITTATTVATSQSDHLNITVACVLKG